MISEIIHKSRVFSYRLADMKEITGELRRRVEAEENERRIASQQNQLK